MIGTNKIYVYVGLLTAIIFIGQISISCSTAPSRNRGSLSDAMDKSRDDNEDDRSVPDESRDPESSGPEDDDEDSRSTEKEDNYSNTGMDFNPLGVWIGLRGGSTKYKSQDIGTYMDFDIIAGVMMSDYIEFDLYAGFKSAYPVVNSNLDECIKDFLLIYKRVLKESFCRSPIFT